MKDLFQYGNRREEEWEILPWIPDPRPPFKIWVKPDQIADKHPDGNDHPAHPAACQHLTQIVTGGHKAHVCTGQKEHKADIGIHKSHADAPQCAAVQPQGDQLKCSEHQHDGQQRAGDLGQIGGQTLPEQLPQLICGWF